MTNTTAIKPQALMTATESIEWFRKNGIKGSIIQTFRNGSILVEFQHMQAFPSGAQAYSQRIRGFMHNFEGVL
jgi:hypothetical protein